MSERKDLPPVTSANFLPRIREELAIMMGNRGEPLDQTVRFKDLQDSKLLQVGPGFVTGNGGGRPIIIGPGPGLVIPPVYVVDLTPPPTPTGFTASAAISNLFVQTDAPLFTVGHGYLRTILYGASRVSLSQPAPTFANAVQLMQFIGPVSSYATNPSTIWHLWVKWMSVDGVLSISPAGGTNGLSVTTGADVQLLINALTGQITASQLYFDLGARINLIDAAGTGLVSQVAREVRTRTNETGSIVALIDTVQAVATTDRGTFTSAIATEQIARANADGTLFAQYSVKVDVNGYVSGFGLSSTANNAAPTSAFAVRADQFYIASPSGPGVAPTVPFIVRTTPTTINGVYVPAGVYVQEAFIANGTISNAKIGNAAIDDAKIANLSVTKLKAGSIGVGEHINSSSYIPGSQGWSINGNGQAEFSNVVVRGTVYASAGTFSGDITAASGNFRGQVTGGAITGYAWPPAGGGSGFYVGPNGLLLGNANDGRYLQMTNTGDVYTPQFNIVNGAASFSGALQAASGSFAGTLSASSAQVDTLNIAGNAVTVPSSTTGSSFGTALFVTLIAGQPVYVSCLADGGGIRYDDSIPRYAYLYVNAELVRTVTSVCAFFNTARYDVQMSLIYNFTPNYTGSHTLQFNASGNEYAAHMFVIQTKR